MCTQSLFFSTLPSIIRLARELRDSDAREESAITELRETLLSASAMMSDKAGGPFVHGDPPLGLHIAGEPVHLDSEDSARLTGGMMLLIIVAALPGAAPSGTVQDAIELLTGVTHAHNRRCPKPPTHIVVDEDFARCADCGQEEGHRPDCPHGSNPADLYHGLVVDSRHAAPGLVFLAVPGLTHDGHAFPASGRTRLDRTRRRR